MSKQLIFLTLILGIFLLSSVSALSQQLPVCWGLEGNHTGALIVCDFGPELFFIGSDIPEEALWTGSGGGAEHLHVRPVLPKEEVPVEEALEKQRRQYLLFLIPISCWLLFLIFGKKQCYYCKKRFRRKDLIYYNKHYYCQSCIQKVK